MEITELMKRYEAETGRKPKDLFMGSEESLIHFTREYVEWLEAQLTWRPAREEPENDRWYVCYCPQLDVNGSVYADDYATCYYADGWCGDRAKDIVAYFNAPFDELPLPPMKENVDGKD